MLQELKSTSTKLTAFASPFLLALVRRVFVEACGGAGSTATDVEDILVREIAIAQA